MQQKSIAPGHVHTGEDINYGKHWIYVAGEAITADKILYVSGTNKSHAEVKLANFGNATHVRSQLVVACHGAAASGDQLRCAEMVVLDNQNTSGSAIGAPVYLSTSGAWTVTPPAGPPRQVGIVLEVSATVGRVLLAPMQFGKNAEMTYVNVAASAAITGTTESATNFDKKWTIPAGRLRAGTVVRVRAQGIHTATTGAETHDMSLVIGSTVIAGRTGLDPANDDIFYFDAILVCRTDGATGTFVASGIMGFGAGGSGAGAGGAANIFFKASTTIDTTVAQDIAVQIDRQAAATDSDSARLDIFEVEVLN